ncbi:1-phosphofructokinase [Clostridium sp. D2Q-11]|uniref:Tagatose-6-phosphate kinase n=1 Tax=Anaeromonas frigoriresistens TaxID=2683708 RepID=A0A942V0L0_9FIRM|nr:1-phosphofructokinase [Anaeromonas frigoriresistens]MBS4537857.1 1-phosphofructokinase [Anaeromonas frigoriresistens]
MIGTVTLNPAVDRRYNIDKFEIGSVKRTKNYSASAGGKGLNVSRVVRMLGEEVGAFGFLGGSTGDYILNELEKLEVKSYFTKIQGTTRTCLNIIDEIGDNIEILEKGPIIEEEEVNSLLSKFKKAITKFDIITISGSIPLGVKDNIYGELIHIANKNNIKTILDTSKGAFIENLKASPYIVKPNKEEVESITGISMCSEENIITAAEKILELGAKNVAISLGAEGMYFIGVEGRFKVNIPKIELVNAVGSGDSSVAGFAVGFSQGLDIEGVLKLANACGISNAMEKNTGFIDPVVVKDLTEKIEISSL